MKLNLMILDDEDEHNNDIKPKTDNQKLGSKISKSYFLLYGSIFFKELYYICIIILQKFNTLHLPSNKLFFLICLYQVFLSVMFMKIDHIDITKKKYFNTTKFDFLIIRCIVECLKTLSIVFSLSNIPYLSCRIIFYISPTFVTYIYLKLKMDSIKRTDKICYILTFLVCIIFFIQYMKGTIYGVIASIFISINILMQNKTCNDFHPYFIVFLSNVFGIFLSPIFINFYDSVLTIGYCEHILCFLCCISGFFDFYNSHKYAKLGCLLERTFIYFISLFLSYLFSIIILDSNPSLIDIFTTLIIIPVSYYSKLRLESSENADDL
jgi:hypothetical protein